MNPTQYGELVTDGNSSPGVTISKITLRKVEGLTLEFASVQTFAEADSFLRAWAWRIPAANCGGYEKTEVVVYFSDGSELFMRYDLYVNDRYSVDLRGALVYYFRFASRYGYLNADAAAQAIRKLETV